LLALNGIGPETADSILLYAGHHPVFVVDAYTRRVLERHDAVAAEAKYDEIRALVESALQRVESSPEVGRGSFNQQRPEAHPPSAMSTAQRAPLAQVYNEMHGLFVQLGKHHCHKRQPMCEACPLGSMLSHPVEPASSSKAEKQPSKAKRQTSKSQRNRGYNQTRP